MITDFSAGPQSLGYFYQVRYALFSIINRDEETEISIENLDDVVFEDDGTATELIQLKHRINRTPNLTDRCPDFWKTIRIWSSHIREKKINENIKLVLITTSTTPVNSILHNFTIEKPIAVDEIIIEFDKISETSQNANLSEAFSSYNSLTHTQKQLLISSICIVDNSQDIIGIEKEIKKRILGVRFQFIDSVYERFEGWWFKKVIDLLSDEELKTISRFEVIEKIAEIAEQFQSDSLPIDFLNEFPPTPPDPENDSRLFVKQLHEINIDLKRIEYAIIDYYRAFQQRSLWVREELLIGDEIEKYEKKLIDEWERFQLDLRDRAGYNETDEASLKQFGKEIYHWVEFEADIKIRPKVTEPYVMRGSYHILSNMKPPLVWWHPKFLERMELILSSTVGDKNGILE